MLVLVGRIHAYEGHDLRHVVHPVRTACAAGVRTVVLTNAAGGLRADFAVGQPVLISDHLNLTARSPLVGAQFVDLVDAYSPRLRALAREVDPTLAEGVYAGLPGPHYETPAEIRMLRTLGADLVGMSTVHETIAARAAGARGARRVAGDEPGGRHDGSAAEPRRGAGGGPSVGDADGLPAGRGDRAGSDAPKRSLSSTTPRASSGAANSISSIRTTCAAMMNVTFDPVSTAVASTA